jgi:hypothetical protein
MDMKVDRGLSGLMSRRISKCTSPGHWPLLYPAALIVLGLGIVLAGCGDLSLNQMLENEEPEELVIVPQNTWIPASGTLDIEGKGGFKPYSYEIKTPNPKGTLNSTTGEYIAPTVGELSGDSEQLEIEVIDYVGSKASTFVTVYKPVRLSPASVTVEVGPPGVDFSATGGVPDYDFYLDDAFQATSSGSWHYDFPTPGTYVVTVKDDLGNRAFATIVVTDQLGIEVSKYWVEEGDSIGLTALNSSGNHVFSIIDSTSTPAGSISDPTANSAAYNAPSDAGDGLVVTIQLRDNFDGKTATVAIHVLEDPPPDLTFPSQVEVIAGGSETSLSAKGGVPWDDPDQPYKFWLEGEGTLNPHPVHANKIQYIPPDFVPAESPCVWVEDAVGQRRCATIVVTVEAD